MAAFVIHIKRECFVAELAGRANDRRQLSISRLLARFKRNPDIRHEAYGPALHGEPTHPISLIAFSSDEFREPFPVIHAALSTEIIGLAFQWLATFVACRIVATGEIKHR